MTFAIENIILYNRGKDDNETTGKKDAIEPGAENTHLKNALYWKVPWQRKYQFVIFF